jgi:integrase
MATLRIRHLVAKGRPGAERHYWQPSAELRAQGWRAERLPEGLQAAVDRAEALNADVDAWRRGEVAPNAPAAVKARAKRPVAGTVAALILDYRDSRWWSALAPRTRASYEWCLDAVQAWAGDMPARAITPRAVQAFYEAQLRRVEGTGRNRRVVETPAKAAAILRVLRLLLQVGERLGYLPPGSNPARRPGISYQRQREPRPWSDAEVAHMAAAADALGWRSIATAIILNAWMGQREGDVLALRPWAVEAEALRLRQGKTGRQVVLPVYLVPHLVERLKAEAAREAAAPVVKLEAQRSPLLLRHDRTGGAWNEHTFRHVFAEVRALAASGDAARDLAPMPSCAELIFRELRHTAVTRLHEAGVDDNGIATITGHSPGTIKGMMDRHYLVRTEKGAVRAIKARLAAQGEGEG